MAAQEQALATNLTKGKIYTVTRKKEVNAESAYKWTNVSIIW